MPGRIFGIGETLLDIIIKSGVPQAAKAGGSVLNAMVSLGRCGHEVYLVSESGNDQSGTLILEFLIRNQVRCNYIKRFLDGQSPLALAFLNDEGNATYEFYKAYPTDRSLKMPDQIRPGDIVLFGSFYAINPDVRESVLQIVREAREAGAWIVYDPNFRKQNHDQPGLVDAVIENMKLAHLVRASDEDMVNLFGMVSIDEVYPLLEEFCSHIVITSNRSDILLLTPGIRKRYPVPQITPVSTIGAGDNFNAGLIHHMARLSLQSVEIPDWKEAHWDALIHSGIEFSTNVCLSLDNYISESFALKHKL